MAFYSTKASIVMNYTKYTMSDLTPEEMLVLKDKLGLGPNDVLQGEDVYSIIDNSFVKKREIPLIETVYAIYDIVESRSNLLNSK